MGTTNRFTLRLASRESNATPGPMPEAWLDSVLDALRPGHPARDPAPVPELPAGACSRLPARGWAMLQMPALVVWGMQDPYIPARFARRVCAGAARRRAGGARRRGPLAVAGPPGRDRAGGGLPERRVSATAPDRQRRAAGRRHDRARLAAARLPPAWTITAALGGRVPDRRAPEPRPGRRELSQRPVLARRLHAVGQLLVRRPPPARLLAARAGARRADRPAAAGGDLDDRSPRRCSQR